MENWYLADPQELEKFFGQGFKAGYLFHKIEEDVKIVLPWRKEVITILLDTDLLDWLRQQQISEKDQRYFVQDLLSDG